MKNTLTDLNNYLFETIERLMDDDLTEEQVQKEIMRSQAVTAIAETIIRNGELALKTIKHLNEYGIETPKEKLPPMLEATGSAKELFYSLTGSWRTPSRAACFPGRWQNEQKPR